MARCIFFNKILNIDYRQRRNQKNYPRKLFSRMMSFIFHLNLVTVTHHLLQFAVRRKMNQKMKRTKIYMIMMYLVRKDFEKRTTSNQKSYKESKQLIMMMMVGMNWNQKNQKMMKMMMMKIKVKQIFMKLINNS